ncbi:ATP phosphoribosyltransferase regulatory subunit [Streptomyces flaveolus]|uniref:ATP phosphoribosyltransferase regulatory subunit n=1 Tax=Streptomyces flaveolus TaxID=67297 RepID=UPI0034254A98
MERLDYYTGTVYEGKSKDWPNYGSICSGGRYENLAGSFIRRNLPGIGMSIGLTRISAKLLAEGLVTTGPSCPSDVLVVLPGDEHRAAAAEVAGRLRGRGLNVELYHQADKVAKQRAADPETWQRFRAARPRRTTSPPTSASAERGAPCRWRVPDMVSGGSPGCSGWCDRPGGRA